MIESHIIMTKWGIRMNKMTEREQYLLNLLGATRRITTAEASKALDVSAATVRRLFRGMEEKGTAVRDYGGIQLYGGARGYSFENSEKTFSAEKRRIGAAAAELVQDGDTVFLDSGTTVMQMALALSRRIASGDFTSLNIVTNSIANVQVLAARAQCRVILAGGEYNPGRRDFSGPLTERYVSPFHFTKSFFGCEGLTAQMGYCSNQLSISSLNARVIARSDLRYALMDASKFGRYALVAYAGLEEISGIVTNAAPDEALSAALEKNKVAVLLAAEERAQPAGRRKAKP